MAPPRPAVPIAGKRMRSREEPYMPSYLVRGQKCVVCSDLATGLHYRAITCEGCKGFFRRVYQRETHFECKAQPKGQCGISKSTRNSCQKCRQERCLQAGMDPQLVLDEVQRKVKRGLIARNRARRQLERRLERIQKALSPRKADEERLGTLADRCARLFWAIFEEKVPKEADSPPAGQLGGTFWPSQVLKFVQAILAPAQLDPGQLGIVDWRPVLLLLAAIGEGNFGRANAGEGQGSPRIQESGGLGVDWCGQNVSMALGADQAWMAGCLAELQLTNVQIALLAALLAIQQVPSLAIPGRDLLGALRQATAQNMANGDTREERLVLHWPVLALRMVQLEGMARKHGRELEEGKLAAKMAAIFAVDGPIKRRRQHFVQTLCT